MRLPIRYSTRIILLVIFIFFPWSTMMIGVPENVAAGENQPPVAMAGNITVAEPGEKVFFSAAGSYDPDGEIVLYEWDFEGDGVFDWNSTETGNTVHVYHKEGAYNATLRVTDNNGSCSSDVYYVLILEKEKETNFDRVRTILAIVGVFEIAAGIGMIAIAIYLKKRLYDRL